MHKYLFDQVRVGKGFVLASQSVNNFKSKISNCGRDSSLSEIWMNYFSSLVLFGIVIAMGAAGVKEVNFEELRDGLSNASLVYLDVRNRDEIVNDGKVVGSVVVPCTY